MSDSTHELYRDAFHTLARTLPGAELGWLRSARRHAFERFEALRFPTTRHEEWKYTNVAPIAERPWRFASPRGGHVDVASIVGDLLLESADACLVFVNGRHVPKLSRTASMPEGVFVGSLTRALREMPERMEPLIARVTPGDGFAALNTAFLSDGYVVVVPEGCRIEGPLQMLFIADEAGLAMQPFNAVLAERGSHCAIVEQYVGIADDGYLTNGVTRVSAAHGAEVEHCRIQEEARRAFHVARLDVVQGAASQIRSHSFAFGGALSRVEIDVRFAGPDARAELGGLYVGRARQHLDHHTRIDHELPRCTSREHYRGVLDEGSHGVFDGRVIVHQGAQQTDAHLANKNLLLSRDAEIDTKPQLEIYADDVKCTHGATVGRLDEQQLFYLRARGMDEAVARATLVWAFARDVIDRVGVDSVRARLTKLLLARTPEAERIRELL
jgi:Fe-S cluster assembly protein SufD